MRSFRPNLSSSIVSRVVVRAPLRVFVMPASPLGLIETAQAQQVVEADGHAPGQLFDRLARVVA